LKGSGLRNRYMNYQLLSNSQEPITDPFFFTAYTLWIYIGCRMLDSLGSSPDPPAIVCYYYDRSNCGGGGCTPRLEHHEHGKDAL
jgi:hypothetical protein